MLQPIDNVRRETKYAVQKLSPFRKRENFDITVIPARGSRTIIEQRKKENGSILQGVNRRGLK
ncbi:hypothetical protein AusDCA_2618 [Desulfitobacterium sp. AusDCA]